MESDGCIDKAAPVVPAAREGTLKRLVSVMAVVAAVTAALTMGATSGQAGLLGCGGTNFVQPFAPWGDSSSYALAPGGSFESGSAWMLAGGAKIVSGNEPFFVGSSSDSHSLLLPAGSSATVPAICLGTLGVSANIGLSTSWNPSGQVTLLLDNVLALTNLGTTKVVFRFSPTGSA